MKRDATPPACISDKAKRLKLVRGASSLAMAAAIRGIKGSTVRRISLDVVDLFHLHRLEPFGWPEIDKVWGTCASEDALLRRWERWKFVTRKLGLVRDVIAYATESPGSPRNYLALLPDAAVRCDAWLDANESTQCRRDRISDEARELADVA